MIKYICVIVAMLFVSSCCCFEEKAGGFVESKKSTISDSESRFDKLYKDLDKETK